MKKKQHTILLICVVGFAVLIGTILWRIRSQHPVQQAVVSNKPAAKPTFKPVDLTGISVAKKQGKVQINMPFGLDPTLPYPSDLQVLATVLQNDKTSQVFVVSGAMSLGGTSVTGKTIYNRKTQTLISQSITGMSGVGITDSRKTICQKVTDAVLFKLLTKNPDASLRDLGSACTVETTPKNLQRKNSKNSSKSP